MAGLLKSNKIGTIIDPANAFGRRPGGMSTADAMDPGGAILKATTGSNIGREVADPGKFLPVSQVPVAPKKTLTEAEKKTAQAKKDKLKRYQRLRARNSTIMSTDLEDFK